MAISPMGLQSVGTITLGPSGQADSDSIIPMRSNAPFGRLSVTIVPLQDPSPYRVTVYHDGELEEQHNYPTATDRTICHMAFPHFIFPANTGTNAIPRFFDPDRKDFYGVPIRILIENYYSENRSFYVYACAETYEHCAFQVINPESVKS